MPRSLEHGSLHHGGAIIGPETLTPDPRGRTINIVNAVASADERGQSPEPTLDDLEVVLVSYKSRHHVETLISSWPSELAVVVVDNSADVDGIVELVAGHPQARYVSGGGQGFGRAANLGAAVSERPYVVFVNPDTRPTPENLLDLVRGLAADRDALAHAATPIDPDGVIELGAGGWKPTIPRAFVHAVGLHKIFRHSGLFAHPRLEEHLDIDWVTGACMAVDRVRFRELGGFDETFFVYCEDTALGLLAARRGWSTRLREDVVVVHGSGTSGAPSSEMRRLQGASYAIFLRRYAKNPAQATVISTLYVLGQAGKMAVLAATGRRERMSATRAVIRGMLTRRAFVGGTEVAHARALEMSNR